ncbi:MAG: type I pantothenate kinase [Myxococcota bacterium]
MELSPYLSFTRDEWAERRAGTPMTLSEDELEALRGLNTEVSLEEVAEVYLPLSRLLSMYVESSQSLYAQTQRFLGHPAKRVPYIIGMAGTVAVGKSTCARILKTLLSRWASSPRVELITTDGFLHPNATLTERGLMHRKGFPESYDQRALLEFVSAIKAGAEAVTSPVYSHILYDIVPGEETAVERPDIVIIEGLNVLQSGPASQASRLFVSDFFDFSIYLDANLEDLRHWYVSRFLTLRDTAFKRPNSYFRTYAELSDDEAIALGLSIWQEINEPNLLENIEPTRARASLILEKGTDHVIERIQLRKL